MYSSKFLTAPIGTSQEISISPNGNLKIDAPDLYQRKLVRF
jgi:hypothetical protein